MRRFRDVSRAVRRREADRRAQRWTVGRRQTRRCVHLAVVGLARLCMGKQTDGWMDGWMFLILNGLTDDFFDDAIKNRTNKEKEEHITNEKSRCRAVKLCTCPCPFSR
jgi:hypothetical protein